MIPICLVTITLCTMTCDQEFRQSGHVSAHFPIVQCHTMIPISSVCITWCNMTCDQEFRQSGPQCQHGPCASNTLVQCDAAVLTSLIGIIMVKSVMIKWLLSLTRVSKHLFLVANKDKYFPTSVHSVSSSKCFSIAVATQRQLKSISGPHFQTSEDDGKVKTSKIVDCKQVPTT